MALFDQALDDIRLKSFAQKLIRTPSLSMEEREVSEVVRSEMEALGYDEVRVDDLFPLPNKAEAAVDPAQH